jgi:dTDP-4-dehydrorhamnose 3,5-epimerase
MFEFVPTPLSGLQEIHPRFFADARGSFVKTFHAELFRKAGLDFQPAEEFYSVSAAGVVRGMHFQLPPHDHAKLVYCPAGRVLDVIVDLRKNSKTYGEHFSRELSAENRVMLYIPSGFAHGFLALEAGSMMVYQTSTVHAPESDAGIHWESFGFDWPLKAANLSPILSDRDRAFPALADFASPF